jgi:hypothetical protein
MMIKNASYLLTIIGVWGCLSLYVGDLNIPVYAASEADKTGASIQRYLTPDDMVNDFQYLTRLIKDTHPNPYTSFAEEEFKKEEKRLITLFKEPMSVEEYRKYLTGFLAKMRDGHTMIYSPAMGQEKRFRSIKQEKKIPFLMHWFENDLYIIDILDKRYSHLKGGKVIGINGMQPNKILERLRSLVSADNDYAVKSSATFQLLNLSTWEYILGVNHIERLEIIYIPHESKRIETMVILPGSDSELSLQLDDSEELKRLRPYNPRTRQGLLEPFKFSYSGDLRAGILQWFQCIDRSTFSKMLETMSGHAKLPNSLIQSMPDFWEFLKEIFSKLRENEAEHLIIDLRWNSGGNSVLGNMLAAYLAGMSDTWDKVDGYIRLSDMYRRTYPDDFKRYVEAYRKINGKEPEIGEIYPLIELNSDFSVPNIPEKDKFEGDVYVLISPCTYSSAMMIAWQLSDNHASTTLVGEPTGQNPCTYGEVLSFVLPKTDIRGGVSCKYFRRTNASLCGQGALYPDFYVPTTYKDFSMGMDTQMVWLEKHLSKK